MTDHTTTPTVHLSPDYTSTWVHHERKPDTWGSLIGETHAYHEFMLDGTEMSLNDTRKLLDALAKATAEQDYDMPKPVEVWDETYTEADRHSMTDEQLRRVHTWAQAYRSGYEQELVRLLLDHEYTVRNRDNGYTYTDPTTGLVTWE